MSRLLAYGYGLTLVALSASPLLLPPDDDSYPLSTYPMFARPRGKPWLSIVEGVDAAGGAVRLTPSLIAHGEVMQAAATVRRAVREGPLAMEQLCTTVAERVANDLDYRHVQEVRVVSARFDPVRYFRDGPTPEERLEQRRCPVSRAP